MKMEYGGTRNSHSTRKIGRSTNRNLVMPYITSYIPIGPTANFSYGLHRTSGHIGRFGNGKDDFSTNLGRIPERVGPLAPGSLEPSFAQRKSGGR